MQRVLHLQQYKIIVIPKKYDHWVKLCEIPSCAARLGFCLFCHNQHMLWYDKIKESSALLTGPGNVMHIDESNYTGACNLYIWLYVAINKYIYLNYLQHLRDLSRWLSGENQMPIQWTSRQLWV